MSAPLNLKPWNPAPKAESASSRGPNKGISTNILQVIHTMLGLIITGFLWDIPILVFAYVLFGALSLLPVFALDGPSLSRGCRASGMFELSSRLRGSGYSQKRG